MTRLRSNRTRLLAPLVSISCSLSCLAAAGCSGDDTNPPAPPATDAGADGSSDATAPSDGATKEDGSTSFDGASATDSATDAAAMSQIQHVVVIYLENHSFDNLFGGWAGADGLGDAGVTQVGPDGNPYTTLPQYGPYPAVVESLGDAGVANAPFNLATYFQATSFTNDLLHRFYQEQNQINGGKMDSYVLFNDESAGQSMGYWPTSSLPVAQWMTANPTKVTLCDHFFHAAFGGSFLNHFWLISAQSPTYANPPAEPGLVAVLDGGALQGTLDTTTIPPSAVYVTSADDGELTPDGYAVNTAYSVNEPHPAKYDTTGASTYALIPQQTFTTIGDELDGAGVKWAWYAGGWNTALAGAGIASVGTDAGSDIPDTGAIDPSIGAYAFEYHHQPFVYFKNWGGTANDGGVGKEAPNGKWAQNKNLQDEQDFIAAAAAGTLPAVSFVKPLYDEHPNYTTEMDSQNHTVSLINDVVNGPDWKDTVIVITYDENGGSADHVAPPKTDKWGPGTRVPGIVISPFAKGGVDSTPYDTTAILALIEKRFGLAALSTRDAAQHDLAANALKLTP